VPKNKIQSEPVRCGWCAGDEAYIAYHDHEWGVPSRDERHLFEMLNLEGAQAGLSWRTILHKREGYRRAFDQFDAQKIARYTPAKVAKLLANPGIVRNRLKVQATIDNAKAYLRLCERDGGLAPYLWGYVNGKPIVNHWRTLREVPARTALSDGISKDLKKRGFRFVGSTICYAYLQAVGVVDDHLVDCFKRKRR
jgi:DNA-3-methyladenine glycosylase I